MTDLLRRLTESSFFQGFIIAVIIFAGIIVGIETYPSAMDKWGDTLHVLDSIILWIFIAEIIMKMGAQGSRPWRYFLDPWNVFDFIIVLLCLIPALGHYAMVIRMVRLLRVFRLVRAIPRLQILVAALLRSIPSMGYVSILLFLLFYMYAVAGVFLFGENDPVHFGDLQNALLSLFRVVTLEDWTDVMYTQMYGCQVYPFGVFDELCTSPNAMPLISPLYFISFVLLGTMIMLNLFIGIIVSSFDMAKEELTNGKKNDEKTDLAEQLKELENDIDNIRSRISSIRKVAEVSIKKSD